MKWWQEKPMRLIQTNLRTIVPFTRSGNRIMFTIPEIEQYETIVIKY